MSSWQIGESGTTVAVDGTGRGEVTFTVTNTGTEQDRSVLTITPLDGAAETWFTVEEPQRAVPPGGSAAYLCRVKVPPGTAAGTYALQAVAYSADRDPGETSAKSKRVALEVKETGPPPPPPKWLPIAIVAAIVAVIGLVLWLVLRGGGGGGLENTSPPTITGTAMVLETLTADPGEWSEGALDFALQWQRCDAQGAACQDIAGATLPSYAPGNDDVGSTLRVGVTATGAGTEATAVSDPTAPVAAANGDQVPMPPVEGFTRSGALAALSGDFQVEVHAQDDFGGSCDPIVFEQTPDAGTLVTRGEQVVISTEPARPVIVCIRSDDPLPPIFDDPFLQPDQPPFTIPEDLFPGS